MPWQKSDPRVYRKSQIVLAVVLAVILVAVLVVAFMYWRDSRSSESTPPPEPYRQSVQETSPAAEAVPAPEAEVVDATSLQRAVDTWVADQSGTASIMITDIQGTPLAIHDADRPYFAASIYKLYVAYEGYRLVDAGNVSADTPYLGTTTRGQCLDIMIRNSDSPCAEKMWAELGKPEITTQLKTYGIDTTNMSALTTTAKDAAVMVARIARGEGLSADSQAKYLASMRDQIYRDTLNQSFAPGVTVYNKIGFRELVEYHDVALVDFGSDKKLVVSVLTEDVGTAPIIALGKALQGVVQSQ